MKTVKFEAYYISAFIYATKFDIVPVFKIKIQIAGSNYL